MAVPPPWPPVTFRPTTGQRAQRLVVGVCCLVAGVSVIVLHSRASAGDRVALLVAGVALAALGIWFLAAGRGATVVDREGVRARSAFRQRSCRWSEVTDVELRIDANDGPPTVHGVRIVCASGSFTLPAPTDSERAGRHDNPHFNDQLATIRSYWRAAVGPRPAR
jgi:hypothetical protein